MEERRGLTIKDLLIRLILIIIFIFLLIWLFPMPDLKPLNNQIFADNVDRMKDVAKSYYTLERLPKNINDSKKMTLKEMIDNKLILPLMDSNGKYCSEEDSYVEITKLENEYIIKVNLSCSDKKDYIIEHYGCYDICSDKCKMLESTSKTERSSGSTTVRGKVTTKNTARVTTKATDKITTTKVTTLNNSGKIYEYEFVKNVCVEQFDKFVCPTGYDLVGDSCIKKGSVVIEKPAEMKEVDVHTLDSQPADPVISDSSETKPAECKDSYTISTIDAGYKKTTYKAEEIITTQTVTADKTISYDIKPAIVTTTTSDPITFQNYDVISADKIYESTDWVYTSTKITTEPGLQYVKENEKLVLIKQWAEPECPSCGTMITWYKYFKYEKKPSGTPKYSCDAYASQGYVPYDGDKCRRKAGTSTSCPNDKYKPVNGKCVKEEYSCSKYGSSYNYDPNTNTCKKPIETYTCPKPTDNKTSDPKFCTRTITKYNCPSWTEDLGNGKCVDKHDYFCPDNTDTKTYEINGTKCTVKTKTKVCSCEKYPNSVQSEDKKSCIIKNSNTTYSCEKYPGYTLQGDTCTLDIITKKQVPSCEKYPGSVLDGQSCIWTEDVTDTIAADKTYKTYCEEKYKWSTSTSIDGWSYTGNKRQVN